MAKIGRPRSKKGLAVFCAKIAEEKLAENITILEIKDIEFAPADYFVICSCDTDTQVKATVDFLNQMCSELDMEKPKLEGMDSLRWVLADFFDVVFHVMLPEVRSYYKIEKLWGDGRFMYLNEDGRTRVMDPKIMDSIYDDTRELSHD